MVDEQMSEEFFFQQSVKVHEGSVRALGTLATSDMLMTGSIDKSSKIFTLNSDTGKYDFQNSVNYHTGFVVSVCPI